MIVSSIAMIELYGLLSVLSLAGALLALGRHRHRPAGRGDALVGVVRQRRGVHVHGLGGHEVVIEHAIDAADAFLTKAFLADNSGNPKTIVVAQTLAKATVSLV